MKNYKQTASDVLRLVGGEKNVVQVEHCSTRLRFTLADASKVDAAALKKTAGVMGVISSGPQCQVVIGNDVIEVYDELLKLGTFNAGQAAAPAAPKGKKEIGGIILDYMVGIFQPLVPAIAGAGVLKALMVLLSTLGLMSSGDIAYKVFVGVADEMGWRKNAANPIANLLISATVGARIKQQVVASFLEAAFDRLFILRGAF